MTDEEMSTNGPSCFRHKIMGVYKTFSPGDFAVVAEWAFVHAGPCECEGKIPPDCIEPGDDG